MKAEQLLHTIITEIHLPDIEIHTVTEDSRQANASSVFVCIKGARIDGHTLAQNVYAGGCRIFVAQQPLSLPSDATVIRVSDTRAALATLAAAFYKHPSRDIHVIGITGTKGKTTTACLISHILNESGIPCGYIGTNGISYANTVLPSRNTTPDAVTLQKTLSDMHKSGIKAVALEVSSQALMQHRVGGIHFGTVLFTNFSPDHVGEFEHPDLNHYRDTKHTLFTDFDAEYAVWNIDDAMTRFMQQSARAKHHITFSTAKKADLTAKLPLFSWEEGAPGISFSLAEGKAITPCPLPLLGECNISNALAAMAVATRIFKIDRVHAARALSQARVPGRSECIKLPNGAAVVIDYAHNGESLKQILTALRDYSPRRLLCLFGSVGERSQMRRGELGAVAARLCDLAILTSDNPGEENPLQIIEEIAAAFADSSTPYLCIPDRREAIRNAVRMTNGGDILLLAGKGHENYQLIGRQKLPFCEREIVFAAAEELLPILQ